MFKYVIVIFAAIACAAAKPHILAAGPLAAAPLAVSAPVPFITAASSQIVARNHNGIALAPVVAPSPIAPVAPLAKVVAPVAAAPIVPVAAPAPLIARYAAAPAPLVSRYAAAPFAYSAPLAAPAAFSYAPAFAPSLRYAAAAPAPVVW